MGVPKSLMAVWAFLDFSLLTFGALAVAMSIVWGQSTDPMIHISFQPSDLQAGLAIGVMLLVTWAFSIGAIVQRPHVTRPLVALNWLLVLDGLAVLIVGSILYVSTLQERANVLHRFLAAPQASQTALQDRFDCCGYFFPNETTIAFGGNVCTSAQAALALNKTCVGPLTASFDVSVNNAFTVTYGFMAAVVPLMLASMCVIKKREESERFKRIDAKRGGRGFV